MEGMFFEMIITNIMRSELIIRQCILFLEEEVQFRPSLSLKLACGQRIHKLHDLNWNSHCKRWQRNIPAAIPWPASPAIEMEIYFQDRLPIVLGQGCIPMTVVSAYLRKEIKISLLMDGVYVGCLYCVLDDRQNDEVSPSSTFLYIHKIDIILLEDIPHAFHIRIQRNQDIVYQKGFHLHYKNKSLFPNIKVPVRMSDVLTLSIEHEVVGIKEIKFVTDSVKRGKTSNYQVWLRSINKNKVGDLKFQYFLENLFLANQRQSFVRNGIFPNTALRLPAELTEKANQRFRRSVIIRQIEEADRRILKINTSMKKIVNDFDDDNESSEQMKRQERATHQGFRRRVGLKGKENRADTKSTQKGG